MATVNLVSKNGMTDNGREWSWKDILPSSPASW